MELYINNPITYYGENKGKIGKGSFSNVYLFEKEKRPEKGSEKGNPNNKEKKEKTKKNKKYAVKLFKDNQIEESFIREISLLMKLNYPNIIKPNDVFYFIEKDEFTNTTYSEIYSGYIMDYAKYSLHKEIKNNYKKLNQGLGSIKIKEYMYQLLLGINYLHNQNIWHRDIKPENILITKNNIIKLADFGISKFEFLYDEQTYKILNLTNNVVTLWYRAPEVLLGMPYNNKIDIWAAGVVMCEMIFGKCLFSTKNITEPEGSIELLIKIFNYFGVPKDWDELTTAPKWNNNYNNHSDISFFDFKKDIHFLTESKNTFDLIKKLLTINPNNRISAFEALKHPYFNDLNNNKIVDHKLINNDFEDKLIKFIPQNSGLLFNLSISNLSTIDIIKSYKNIFNKIIHLNLIHRNTNNNLYKLLSSNKYLFSSLTLYKNFISKFLEKKSNEMKIKKSMSSEMKKKKSASSKIKEKNSKKINKCPISLRDIKEKYNLYFAVILYIICKLYDSTDITPKNIVNYLRIEFNYNDKIIQDTLVKVLFILDFDTMYSNIYHFLIYYHRIYIKVINNIIKAKNLKYNISEFYNKWKTQSINLLYILELYQISFTLHPQIGAISILNIIYNKYLQIFNLKELNIESFQFKNETIDETEIEINREIIKNKSEIINTINRWNDYDQTFSELINIL